MKREEVILQLIENELVWLCENFDRHNLAQVAEFFRDGGFNDWTDKELLNKHDAVYGEEA